LIFVAKFQLSLTADYVSNWGIWEALREIVQNGLDAQQDGHTFTIRRGADAVKTVSFATAGTKLERKVWLLGTSSKANGSYRGHFGEGLKLGMLALARLNVPVRIINDDETWTPSIEHSAEFNAPVLTISTRKLPAPTGRFEIQVSGISDLDWTTTQSRFLDLEPASSIHEASVVGQVLRDEDRKGRIYIKGIFVQDHEKLQYGYNFLQCATDRDRGMVDSWNLVYNAARAWHFALSLDASLAPTVYDLLEDEAYDVSELPSRLCGQDLQLLVDEFHSRHGSNVCPVLSDSEGKQIEHMGVTPIVCSNLLCCALRQDRCLRLESIKETAKRSVTTVHPLNSIGYLETCVLRTACALLTPAAEKLQLPNPLDHVQVVDFCHNDTLGMYDNTGDRLLISLSRQVLGSLPKCLEVLAHELAHCRGGDGDVAHQRTEGLLFATALASHAQAVESQLIPSA
jgi:hypothetical protein